jgi:hypothetical protein
LKQQGEIDVVVLRNLKRWKTYWNFAADFHLWEGEVWRDRQTDRQSVRGIERQNLSEDRTGKMGGKWFYPLHVESQLPSDDSVENNDDSWPVTIGCVLVSKQDVNEE